MIDTVVLAGNTDFHNHTFHGYLGGPADGAAAEEQWIFVRHSTWYSSSLFKLWFFTAALVQQIEATLSASTADYLIVAGHYPVWSICEDGPTQVLIDRLKPMLEKYKVCPLRQHRDVVIMKPLHSLSMTSVLRSSQVSAYLAGHDHCAQYIDEGLGVQYHGVVELSPGPVVSLCYAVSCQCCQDVWRKQLLW